MNRIYRPPKCRKYPNTSLGTHETRVSLLGKNKISGPHTEENFHTLSKVPRNIRFTIRQKTHFQFINMLKICRGDARYPCDVDFTNRQNRIFFRILFFPSLETHVEWVPRLLLWYFLHFLYLWLLTGSGQSINGNKTVFGRKLDSLLRESGSSVDGNWTFVDGAG